jgi:Uma2 family endonuclease
MGEGEGLVRPSASPAVKLTYEDFVNFPDDGNRHEIIDGAHYVTPSPGAKHQTVSLNLCGFLWTYLRQNPIGRLFDAPFDVLLSTFDIVEPDLLYISRERLEILTAKNVRGAPDLVMEILSPSTRRTDEITKRQRYELFGVQEYWVVDPELDAIKVYRRGGRGKFAKPMELTCEHDDTISTPLLPGWSVPLTEIFASPL